MAKYQVSFDSMMQNEDAQLSGKVIRDEGGVTKYGISFNFLKNLRVEIADFDHDGVIDEDDIVVMTFEQARALYEQNFWHPIHGDDLVSQDVADKLLDMSVNMGPVEATLLAQRAVRATGAEQIKDDGVFGSKTLAAINAAEPLSLLTRLREFSVAFYKHIATVRVVSRDEFRSWMRRALA